MPPLTEANRRSVAWAIASAGVTRGVIAFVMVGLAAVAPSSAGAKATTCSARDARDMLREAGQGFNGRVLEIHEDRLVIEAESRHDESSIAFGSG